jgi:hypothetical protein
VQKCNNKTKNIKLNNKNIQTLPHDTKSLLTTIKKFKNTYIVGNKGFNINKYITIVTPKN